jgi:hypothetical protein
VAIGYQALAGSATTTLNTGTQNTAVGYQAGAANTSGFLNTYLGYQAGAANASGTHNTYVGSSAGVGNTSSHNTIVGANSYNASGSGTANVVVGSLSAQSNTSGNYNTAVGYNVFNSNTTGSNNAAYGFLALASNVSGDANVAIGRFALRYYQTTTGQVAIGDLALQGNSTVANNTGIQNTAIGYLGLTANTSGSDNTAVGYQAGNTNTTGSDNTYIGLDAKGLATGNWQIGIGSGVQPTASNLGAWGGNTNATRTDLGIGIFTPTARLHIATLAVGNKGLIIDGIASQTANLVEVNATTGGTNYVTVNSGGAVSMSRRATTGIATLTDAATISLDASLGNHFRVTLGGNRTLAAPSNPTDGQRIMIEVIQDGTGGRTLTLTTGTNGFAFGTDITGITLSTAINARDFIGAVYNSTAQRWYVIAFVKGY